jgi:acetyl-CoA acyltransferase
MSESVWILGIHMTKFGKHFDKDPVDLAAEAALGALADAGVTMKEIGVLAGGHLMGASGGIGQQLQKQIGQTGIPVYNVANACATGATALRTAVMAIKAGEADYGLAFGVEKLSGAGLLGGSALAKENPTWTPAGRNGAVVPTDGRIGTMNMPGVFAQVGTEYDHKYGGATFELFARISEKNHAHSTLNPLAAYQKRFTLDQIMGDIMIAYPNTRPMCSANCDGAAAAVVVSDSKLKTLSLEQQRRAVKISAESGATWRDGKQPVNVSGGLESKGHPIAATGIANIWEVCHHLRGEAGDRQIKDAKVGLAHVIGLGSACGVHVLEKSAL